MQVNFSPGKKYQLMNRRIGENTEVFIGGKTSNVQMVYRAIRCIDDSLTTGFCVGAILVIILENQKMKCCMGNPKQ
jgi:hypothetical protein